MCRNYYHYKNKRACEVDWVDPLKKPEPATQQGAEEEQREYSLQLEV